MKAILLIHQNINIIQNAQYVLFPLILMILYLLQNVVTVFVIQNNVEVLPNGQKHMIFVLFVDVIYKIRYYKQIEKGTNLKDENELVGEEDFIKEWQQLTGQGA